MSRIERDIYLTLLIFQFDLKNKLPGDLETLIRITESKTKKEKNSLNFILKNKFKIIDGFLINNKMAEVLKDADLYREKQKNNGSKGGRPRNPPVILGYEKNNPTITPVPTSVSVPINTTNKIEDRKLKFATSLIPFVKIYGKEMIRKFCDYWSEPNKSNSKFRMELCKTWDTGLRLKSWQDRQKDFKKQPTPEVSVYIPPRERLPQPPPETKDEVDARLKKEMNGER